jgi:serine/threonine-protein kinase
MILVAVRDAPRREAIRAALAHEGWLVSVVGSLDSAFRMAADHAPRLVVLDSGLPGSDDLVDVFARANGGPGILLVGEPADGLRLQVDAVVDRDVDQRDLVGAVKRCLDAPRPEGRKPRQDGSRRWTSAELFGEILEDLDAAVAAVELRGDEEAPPERSPLESATIAVGEREAPAAWVSTAREPVGARDEEEPAAGLPGTEEAVAEEAEMEQGLAAGGAEVEEGAVEVEEAPTDEEPVVAPVDPELATRPLSLADIERALPLDEPELEPFGEAEAAPFDEEEEVVPVDDEEEVVPVDEEEAAVEWEPSPETEAAVPTAEADPGVFGLFGGEDRPAPGRTAALDALADALLGTAARGVERVEAEEEGETVETAASEPVPEPAATDAPEAWDIADPFAHLVAGASEEHAPEPEDAGEAEEPLEGAVEEPEHAAAEPEPAPERRVGAYRLVERIGEGAAHELWRAAREDAEGAVVVRIVHESVAADERIAERFLAAGLAAGGLEHPNVVPLLEAGWVDGQLIGVRELVEGLALDDVLAGMRELGVRMPLGLALAVGERVAAALAKAHAPEPSMGRAAGTVHGGLHPGNVLLSFEGEVRVTDFGVSHALGEDAGDEDAGLLRYRAPEQIAGDEPDQRSDLFSFGTLLYELVTGRQAFPGRDAGAVASAILNEAAEEPEKVDPTVPAEVGGLVSRLLKRRRDERLQGAGEAQRKLDLALQGLPSPPGTRELAAYLRQLRDAVALVRSVGEDRTPFDEDVQADEDAPPAAGEKLVPVPAERGWRSRRYWLAAAVLLLLAIGVALAYWWGRRGEDPAEAGTPLVVPEPPPRPSTPGARPLVDDGSGPEGLDVPSPPPVEGAGAERISDAEMEALVAEEFARRQREREALEAAAEEEDDDDPPDDDEPPAPG